MGRPQEIFQPCRSIGVGLLGIAVLLGPSCGPSQRKPVYPVYGSVSFQGQPTPEAVVVFHPLSDDPLLSVLRPHGTVEADGSFTLTTYTDADGAPAGEYVVTVEWRPLGADAGDPESNQVPDKLQGRYSNPTTSPLRAQIKKGDNELPPLELSP